MTITPVEVCAGAAGRPHVVIVVAHRGMRELIIELLQRDHGCWTVSAIDSVSQIDHTASSHPDLVVVDTADVATVCRQLPPTFALAQVVVIGPEPDPAYRQAALRCGAGAWLSRDRIAEELCDALCAAHACACESHPMAAERIPNPPSR